MVFIFLAYFSTLAHNEDIKLLQAKPVTAIVLKIGEAKFS